MRGRLGQFDGSQVRRGSAAGGASGIGGALYWAGAGNVGVGGGVYGYELQQVD